MATNVFGAPVTDDTVQLLFPNITNPTARDRAQAALQYMNADNKATNVSQFVHNLKRRYGTGTSTLGMFYNATGGNLTFVLQQHWEGSVWQSPFPQVLQNGQWAGFLHVRDRLIRPSQAAIVYRGQNNDGASRDWLLSWNTTRMNYDNNVYSEIRAGGNFGSANWNTIRNNLTRQGLSHVTTTLGGNVRVTVGNGSSPEFVGIISLSGLNNMALASDVSVVSQSLDSKYVDDDGASADDDDDDDAPKSTAADDATATTTTATTTSAAE